MTNRNQEGRGFTGTGLCLTDGVVPLQRVWQYRGLDGGTVLESEVRYALHQFIAQAQVVKAGLALFRFHLEIVQGPGGSRGFRLTPTTAPPLALSGGRGTAVLSLLALRRGLVRRLLPRWLAVPGGGRRWLLGVASLGRKAPD
jgi:hypothetical protein